jgi:hypothetical protein
MRSAWLRRQRYVPHDNHRSLRQWKMSTHSIRKCATKPCQVIVSSHDNSIWRHTLLERRSLRLARLTHSGLPVDLEHTPTMCAMAGPTERHSRAGQIRMCSSGETAGSNRSEAYHVDSMVHKGALTTPRCSSLFPLSQPGMSSDNPASQYHPGGSKPRQNFRYVYGLVSRP